MQTFQNCSPSELVVAQPLGDRRFFRTLDGMRGVAAIAIINIHFENLFGKTYTPSGYLAVDFFFILSGFVVAYAYDRRFVNGMSAVEFLLIRVIRLYPLYLFATTIGIATHVLGWKFGVYSQSIGKLLLASITSILALPTPSESNTDALFPYDMPSWSLFFEFIANVAFCIFWKRLGYGVLAAIVALSALWLAVIGIRNESLNGGAMWENSTMGLPRVLFSFFLGVSILRLKLHEAINVKFPSGILITLLCVIFMAEPPHNLRIWFDLGVVVLVFPLLVTLGAAHEPGVWAGWLFELAGTTSYAIYIIHFTLLMPLKVVFTKVADLNLAAWPSTAAFSFMAIFTLMLFILCWAVDRFYDQPVRRRLTRSCGRTLVSALHRRSATENQSVSYH